MKTTTLVSTVCLLFCLSFSGVYSQGTWEEKNGLFLSQPYSQVPFGRGGASGFSLNAFGYMGMGVQEFELSQYRYLNDLYAYNPSQNKWIRKSGIPISGGRAFAAAFTANGKGYICIGRTDYSGNGMNDTWEYDPVLESWTQKTDFIGTSVADAFSMSIGNKGYVGGGTDENFVHTNAFFEYDPAINQWTARMDFPGHAYRPATFTIGSIGYLGGGQDSLYTPLQEFWSYDPSIDYWDQRADASWYTLQFQFPSGFSIDSFGYLIADTSCYEYDPIADSWTQKSNVPASGLYGIGMNIGHEGYLLCQDAGVFSYNRSSDQWTKKLDPPSWMAGKMFALQGKAYHPDYVYDPQSDTWTNDTTYSGDWLFTLLDTGYAIHNGQFQAFDAVSRTWTPRTAPPISGLFFSCGNKAYTVETYNLRETWEYNPQTDAWTRKSDFPGCSGDIAFNIDNKGYIHGGWCDSIGWYSNELWEYDAASDSWLRKSDFPGIARISHFGVGVGHKGYIGEGIWDAVGSDLDDIWEYDPANDSWNFVFGNPLGGRHGLLYFELNDNLYLGCGRLRLSQLDAILYSDLWEYRLTSTDVSETKFTSTGTVYPNPVTSTVTLPENSFGKQAEFFSMTGQCIHSFKLDNASSRNLDLTDLLPGMYILRISGEGKSEFFRIVKE